MANHDVGSEKGTKKKKSSSTKKVHINKKQGNDKKLSAEEKDHLEDLFNHIHEEKTKDALNILKDTVSFILTFVQHK